ncbi:hypothetical protein D8674_022472 [Pyrus ussuriensis x Pyrus communis]|uniref:CTP synthase N-terminal domain-containing protein n=1 Tax=Pyrus ussuriensis x Pyrus communis TaxID=2448454 RepID=A0A5N5GYP6_9ROSA|nr:hypothetical protein D8674_022472 [Pyrus ussuriensis x Pyrus communis]
MRLQTICASGVTHQDIVGHEVTIRTQDMQVNLDLGNYECFLDVTLNRDNNITTGKIYQVHHQLLESLTLIQRDFRSYFSIKRKSPYIEASCAAHPTTDVLINFASYKSAAASSIATLKQPTIRVVAIIAEAGAFKIGDTAGTIDNIIHYKLYKPRSVGFVSKFVCS